MKLIKINHPIVHISEIKDGQLAIIREWIRDEYVGRIVQRHGNNLIAVGLPSHNSWGTIFRDGYCNISNDSNCMIEILSAGSVIEI